MNTHLLAATFVLASIVSGCAVDPASILPGTPQDQLQSLGRPTATYPLATGTRLQYSTQPTGSKVFNIDLDASGHVVSAQQVLQASGFARIQIDHWKMADVQREFGLPAEVARVYSFEGPIWSYRYHEFGGALKLFHVYFDDDGVVRRTDSTDDPAAVPNLNGM